MRQGSSSQTPADELSLFLEANVLQLAGDYLVTPEGAEIGGAQEYGPLAAREDGEEDQDD